MASFEPGKTKRKPRSRFFLWMGLVILIAVFIGFSRTWFFQPWNGAPALPASLHLHGLVAVTWILVFLIQTVLVDRNLVGFHRRLGVFGAVVAILLAISSILVSIEITISHGRTVEAIDRMGLVFVVVLTFLFLVGMGVWFRRNPASHKRYMLLATVQAATPAIGRFPVPEPFQIPCAASLIMLLLVSVIIYDLRTLGRVHVATIFGVTVVVLSIPGRLLLGTTELWTRFATQIVN